MSPAAWEDLKADYRERGLTAPCCGAPVVPVRSPTGWQFFRHRPNTGCDLRESVAHIVCKSIMARAAARLGLEVTTEARADDGTWVADVLVRHPNWTVALEAQLSRIPLAAIEERQERYREAGIRGAWLVGYDIARLEARRDLPLFRLEVKRTGRLEPAVIGPATDGTPARTYLGPFAEALLTGRVRFEGPPPQASMPSVATVPSVCWKCRRDIDLAVALVNVPAHAMFAPHGVLPARDLGKLPGILAAYRDAIPALHGACGSLTPLRRPPPARLALGMRAHCPWCDAPISLQGLPETSLRPGRWLRCWTLAGEAWTPPEPRASRWTWSGSADWGGHRRAI
ncbi:competence protein CoiA [Skermanella pratensis]|uniref:competence protein CoiA n=1 Tax=Skermanella pratensis TaxID=2233999 RepID=UPI0017887A40|nr:competence protein CoiA family protein [Skermanella pratensis]